jgi:DNA-binding LytR/AlgR family response regulator
VIIVDDEPLARERLRGMLAARKECTLVAECQEISSPI